MAPSPSRARSSSEISRDADTSVSDSYTMAAACGAASSCGVMDVAAETRAAPGAELSEDMSFTGDRSLGGRGGGGGVSGGVAGA